MLVNRFIVRNLAQQMPDAREVSAIQESLSAADVEQNRRLTPCLVNERGFGLCVVVAG